MGNYTGEGTLGFNLRCMTMGTIRSSRRGACLRSSLAILLQIGVFVRVLSGIRLVLRQA